MSGSRDGGTNASGDGRSNEQARGGHAEGSHDNLNDSRFGAPRNAARSENTNQNSEQGNQGNEGGNEGGGENGSENPPVRDPVCDEAIPRPPRRDNSSDSRRGSDYVWPIPENNPPVSRVSASGGYNTQIRPGGSSSRQEQIVGVSGGGSVLPVLIIGP